MVSLGLSEDRQQPLVYNPAETKRIIKERMTRLNCMLENRKVRGLLLSLNILQEKKHVFLIDRYRSLGKTFDEITRSTVSSPSASSSDRDGLEIARIIWADSIQVARKMISISSVGRISSLTPDSTDSRRAFYKEEDTVSLSLYTS